MLFKTKITVGSVVTDRLEFNGTAALDREMYFFGRPIPGHEIQELTGIGQFEGQGATREKCPTWTLPCMLGSRGIRGGTSLYA